MISKTTTEEDLRTLFGPYGNVQEVFILHDTSGQSKGCGFVRYDTRDQAVAAISALNGTHYMQVRSRSSRAQRTPCGRDESMFFPQVIDYEHKQEQARS